MFEEMYGPHEKFSMFFTERRYNWKGERDLEGCDFMSCLFLCSTYNHMKRILQDRPEVVEFACKWRKEITPEDLEAFIKWEGHTENLNVYHAVLSAIALGLAPFYKDDLLAKEYIDMLANSHGLMKHVASNLFQLDNS
jgi:hypothetical protein